MDETETAHEALTVADILDEPVMRGCRVIAGGRLLGRRVVWCVPWSEALTGDDALVDVVVHARVSDLFDSDPDRPRLDRLGTRRPAALLLHGDTSGVPAKTLDSAGYPVVQLPATATFVVCNRLIAAKTLTRAAHVLEYGVTVHRTLGELLYRGAGLPALGRQLAKLSRCPAFILDAQGEVLAYEYLGTGLVPDPSEVVRLLRDRIVDGDQPAGTRVVELALEDEAVTCVVAPILLGMTGYGWIVLVELTHPVRRQELAQHQVVADQAVTIVGSEMLRLRSVEAAEERARGDFVHALLHGRFANPHDLIARAAHHAFDIEATYGVVVARVLGREDANPVAGRLPGLARRAQQLLPHRGQPTLATAIGDVLVAIRRVPQTRGTRPSTGTRLIADYARALADDLHAQSGRTFTVAYGRPVPGARGVSESYREARVAMGVCERLGITEVSGYGELRVFAALADLATSAQGAAFAREVLAPLHGPDGARGELEAAVLAYVEEGGNLNATARRLRVHRNTMLYKLQRASRLLDLDLRQPENRFTVWLAHRVVVLGEVQTSIDREFRPAG